MKTCRWRGSLVGSLMLIVAALMIVSAVPTAGAVPQRACDLLALTDVTGLLGGGFTARPDVALSGNPTQSHCAYHSSGISVVITLHKIVQDAAQYLQSEQAGMAQQRGVTITPVVGLGTGAFYFQGPNAGPAPGLFEFHFGKGKRIVRLWVATGGRPNIVATQALAAITYARLP